MPPSRSRCFDPTGRVHGIPTYPWRLAPDGYATRRRRGRAVWSPAGSRSRLSCSGPAEVADR